ncbi:MAG: prolipoprotein diacylglyceryl transferase [Gammaproteobacteria bacterium]|nr:MAG: prolipoprotein diacylglyceryl transferase [Gammaproteobacteria bacterium]RTZ59371.1 MAG: prolipoprotein diacylglyceryl transferase [Gammaproteobacteria bacterium]
MIMHPNIDPVAIHIGPLSVHWYGIAYLVAFLLFWWLGILRARRPDSPFTQEEIGDLLFYGMWGVVLGGRIGYVLFYNLDFYLRNPVNILYIWDGGMSFHGGLIGVLIAMWWFGRQRGASFLRTMDFVAPLTPPGFFIGRLANFVNQELWGRPTDVAWGVVFPRLDNIPRHPSQLYEATLEGLVLFAILWVYSARPRATGRVSALFLIFYGLFRFVVEFFREPDRQIGFVAFGWLTKGHLLSIPMVLAGLFLYWWAGRQPSP